MSSAKKEHRRAALLEAAAHVFAEQGLTAPVSLISSSAGFSEGAFFAFFKSKDELINVLYRELRIELVAAVLADFPRDASVRQRLQHVFDRFVAWGIEHPASRKSLRLVSLADVITPRVRAEVEPLFVEIRRIHRDAIRSGEMPELPPLVAAQTLKSLAEMIMDLIEAHREDPATLKAVGFRLLWGALTAKPSPERTQAPASAHP
jgi:AcrR family transcriptional regulator